MWGVRNRHFPVCEFEWWCVLGTHKSFLKDQGSFFNYTPQVYLNQTVTCGAASRSQILSSGLILLLSLYREKWASMSHREAVPQTCFHPDAPPQAHILSQDFLS